MLFSPIALYVHFPWCLSKCPYCDFNTYVEPNAPMDAYIATLICDLNNQLDTLNDRNITSIFLGGGTPSLFAPGQITTLLDHINNVCRVDASVEITMEANPSTLSLKQLMAYRQAGVNRLSIGIQSFNDHFLHVLGRTHDSATAKKMARNAHQVFDNFNLDLMYGLPGQSTTDLSKDVMTALHLAPTHLSLYELTIEPGTRFANERPVLPDEDSLLAMDKLLGETLGNYQYHRYEVSAWARSGYQCKHNSHYWRYGDYLGIGAGAHSKLTDDYGVKRSMRWRKPASYMRKVAVGQSETTVDRIDGSDVMLEYLMNALRLVDGFSLPQFEQSTGLSAQSLIAKLTRLQTKGLVNIDPDSQYVKVSRDGFALLDEILRQCA